MSLSPPGPRCPGLRGRCRAGASFFSGGPPVPPLCSWLWFRAATRGARGGMVTPPPPRFGLTGQEAHQGFLRRAGAPPELLQVHRETQGDAAPLLHQTPPLQSLQLPPALQIAPRAPANPGPPRSQGKPLLPSFSFPNFSFLRSAPAGLPLSPRRCPLTISPPLPTEPCLRPGGDAPVSSSRRRSHPLPPKQLLHLRKPRSWSCCRPLSSLWFPLCQVCPRSPVPPAARDIAGAIDLAAHGAGTGRSPAEPFCRGWQEGNAVFLTAPGYQHRFAEIGGKRILSKHT